MTDLITTVRQYAEDHYYLESWDIVATRWSSAEIGDAIKGARTRRGAIAKAWGKLQVIDRKRPKYERPVRPMSLIEFLAANGGLRCDDKLITEVRESVGGNVMVPRFGPLIRQPLQLSTAARMGGHRAPKFLDAAREAAVAAGYLADAGDVTGNAAQSMVNDLLEAIDEEARGNKIWPRGQQPYEPAECRQEEASDACPF